MTVAHRLIAVFFFGLALTNAKASLESPDSPEQRLLDAMLLCQNNLSMAIDLMSLPLAKRELELGGQLTQLEVQVAQGQAPSAQLRKEVERQQRWLRRAKTDYSRLRLNRQRNLLVLDDFHAAQASCARQRTAPASCHAALVAPLHEQLTSRLRATYDLMVPLYNTRLLPMPATWVHECNVPT